MSFPPTPFVLFFFLRKTKTVVILLDSPMQLQRSFPSQTTSFWVTPLRFTTRKVKKLKKRIYEANGIASKAWIKGKKGTKKSTTRVCLSLFRTKVTSVSYSLYRVLEIEEETETNRGSSSEFLIHHDARDYFPERLILILLEVHPNDR